MNANHSTLAVPPSAIQELPNVERKFAKIFLFTALIALPIPFGGVHEEFNLPFSIALSMVLISLALRVPSQIGGIFAGTVGRGSQLAALCLGTMIIYAGAQFLVRSLLSVDHPILGQAPERVDTAIFMTGWREMINFLGVFLLTRLYLGESRSAQRSLTRVLIVSGAIVSVIAVTHWLYDNGMLFWTFTPETVIPNKRARWPFVNPNHLGDFLAPIFFLTLGGVVGLANNLFEREIGRGRRRNRTLVALISSEDFHIKVIKPVILSLPLLSITIALLGSQSRGAWIGTSLALLLFTYLSSNPTSQKDPSDSTVVHLNAHTTRRRGRSRNALRMDGSWALITVDTIKRYIKPLVAFGGVGVVLFFLNAGGRDLVAGRLEYGLLHSMDDIRWTFYADSWKIFLEHPLFGVGLGAWAEHFSAVASPMLAGLNPVYLHSDPYQLMIELGLVGILPMAALTVGVIVISKRALQTQTRLENKLPIISTFCALISFSIATLPEFPLRIPAISCFVATLLALLFAQCENVTKNTKRNE